jgi:hypothetical protein
VSATKLEATYLREFGCHGVLGTGGVWTIPQWIDTYGVTMLMNGFCSNMQYIVQDILTYIHHSISFHGIQPTLP